MWIFGSESPDETYDFGKKMAKLLNLGDTICLVGELGAGKTLLAKGICNELGVEGSITSPTFTVLNVYDTPKLPIYHFDLYRLDRSEELYDVGFYEYVNGCGIAIIEWSDKFYNELPDEYLLTEIKYDEDQTRRLICISAKGNRYCDFGKELEKIAGFSLRHSEPGVQCGSGCT